MLVKRKERKGEGGETGRQVQEGKKRAEREEKYLQTTGVNPMLESRATSSATLPNRIAKKLHVIPRFQVWAIKKTKQI